MKPRIGILVGAIVLLLLPKALKAQGPCGVPFMTERHASLEPGYEHRSAMMDQLITTLTQAGTTWRRSEVNIPVVVHIVYNDEMENISDAQVWSQIEILNADFAGIYIPDDIPDEFANLYTDVGIRFCMASKDPDGLQTTGITRTFTSFRNIGLQEASSGEKRVFHRNHGGADAWDTKRYMNIWVCRLDQYLGYATKPGDAIFAGEDGIVIDFRSFGSLGTAVANVPNHLGRTTTHEVGHYLGLLHLWGPMANGCGDDLVDDTPTQGKPHYGCPNYPQHSCGFSNMFMNFMDYTSDGCMHMFTPGQGARMRATIEGLRNELLLGGLTHCEAFETPQASLKDRIYMKSNIIRDQITLLQETAPREVLYLLVTDISGRVIHTSIRISQKEINLKFENTLAPGLYLLNIRTKKDQTTFKFLSI